MTIAKKVGLGALVLVVVLLMAAVVAAVSTARSPVRAVGAQQGLATDPGHPAIPVTIFYPTADKPRWRWLGTGLVKLASNGAVDGRDLPLVVMSHGTGGTSITHIDTALALAGAGYVVAAPLHTGDNLQDQSSVGTDSWMTDRARHLARVNDWMLAGWSGRSRVDASKLGIFGYSAGGTAALLQLGARLDPARVQSHCAARPEFVCRLLKLSKPSTPAASGRTGDLRVKAAVLVAPGLGFGFPEDALASVRAPVQLWAGSADANVPPPTNAALLAGMLPGKPQVQMVEGAAHFSFLPPCGLLTPILPPMLCKDPGAFDRSAFQERFNRSVVEFFDKELRPRS